MQRGGAIYYLIDSYDSYLVNKLFLFSCIINKNTAQVGGGIFSPLFPVQYREDNNLMTENVGKLFGSDIIASPTSMKVYINQQNEESILEY